ncbi:MAG: hypothetical protein ACXACD_18935 [Candidatus Thorarchaeota archaeon]|jgi:hypothetical protein
MWNEDVFTGSKLLFQWWGEFLNEVSNEYGSDKAIKLFLRAWAQRGMDFADRMKNSTDINLKTIANRHVNNFNRRGFDVLADVTSTTIRYTTKRCPWYEGFTTIGIPHATVQAICEGIQNIMNKRLRENYHPAAGYALKFRSTANDVCVEEVILKP